MGKRYTILLILLALYLQGCNLLVHKKREYGCDRKEVKSEFNINVQKDSPECKDSSRLIVMVYDKCAHAPCYYCVAEIQSINRGGVALGNGEVELVVPIGTYDVRVYGIHNNSDFDSIKFSGGEITMITCNFGCSGWVSWSRKAKR